jgi:P27 family predicted phage terminase small subunit
MGRTRTPTKILKLRDSSAIRKYRKDREGEPPAIEETPETPDFLNNDAKKIWNRYLEMLESIRVMSKIDAHGLARLSSYQAKWNQLERESKGKPDFELIKVQDKLEGKIFALERSFGLSPEARSRVKANTEDQPEKSKERFFA